MAYNALAFAAPRGQSTDIPYPSLPYVTPEMKGALADGVHNDLSAIQAAIDTGQSVIFAQAGIYNIGSGSGLVLSNRNQIIWGNNATLNYGGSGVAIDGTSSYPQFVSVHDLGVVCSATSAVAWRIRFLHSSFYRCIGSVQGSNSDAWQLYVDPLSVTPGPYYNSFYDCDAIGFVGSSAKGYPQKQCPVRFTQANSGLRGPNTNRWIGGRFSQFDVPFIIQGSGNVIDGTTGEAIGAQNVVTITIASPGVVTWANHGFAAGTPIYFATTGALPTGLTAGTPYYVIASGLTTNTFEVSATLGGSAVNTSGSQSGTQTATGGTYFYQITNSVTTSLTAGCANNYLRPQYSEQDLGSSILLIDQGSSVAEVDLNGLVTSIGVGSLVTNNGSGTVFVGGFTGTYIPTLTDGTNSPTYNTGLTKGSWSINGNMVTVSATVVITNKGSLSGALRLSLPFPVISTLSNNWGGVANFFSGITLTGSRAVVTAQAIGGQSYALLYATGGSAGDASTALTDAMIANATDLEITFSYRMA